MLVSLKNKLKWGSAKNMESKKNQGSLLLTAFIGLLEDILLWRKIWLSLSCIFFLNVLFLMCIHWEVNILESIFCICATVLSMDAFETWLKYKHRTNCLKKLASHGGFEVNTVILNMKNWVRRRWMEFVYLRETNHTKAFLLVSIFFSMLFLLGKYISGYVLLYSLFMALCVLRKIAPSVHKFVRKIQQHAEWTFSMWRCWPEGHFKSRLKVESILTESDGELEGLMPDVSDVDIKLLSIEPELPVIDDRQSLDYWKPEDLPLEDGSDSSENSSSLVTNLSMEKMRTFDKDVETSDSSEDEYIPLEQQKDQLQSTLEVIQPASTWSSSAYNALFNITGVVTNMMYSAPEQTKRKRVSSVDSSDGFEMIDKNDLN